MLGRRVQAILVAFASLSLAAADSPTRLSIRSAVGSVEVRDRAGDAWRPARIREPLEPGLELRCGPGARAELSLPAGAVRVFEQSLLRVPARADGDARVDLLRGAAAFEIRHREVAGPFEVHTAHAVVLVKGTRFTVIADPDASSVSVSRGLLGVREPDSLAREILVHPGFGVTGGAGRPFALGLLSQKGDPWQAWSAGAAPSRPMLPPAGEAPPAAPGEADLTLQAGEDVAIRVLAGRLPSRVHISSSAGLDAFLTRSDLNQVLRGNTAVLGPQLLGLLHLRGVTPAAFAHQVLDNL